MSRPTLPPVVPLALLLGAALAGCGPEKPSDEAPATPPPARGPAPIVVSQDPWVLSTESWGPDSRPAYLGNGYLGQRFSLTGTGFPAKGEEPAFLSGFYVSESIAALPPLLPVRISAGQAVFGADPARIQLLRQELKLQDGLLHTRGTWEGAEVEIETALLRQQPDLALARIRIKNSGSAPVQVTIPDTSGSRLVKTAGGVTVESSLSSLDGGAQPGATYTVAPGAEGHFAALSRVSGGPVKLEKPTPSLPAVTTESVEQLLSVHRDAWHRLWEGDIAIEGDPEAQQVLRACRFQLLSSTRADSDGGVPPMGLSGNAFGGHVFWDMDSWMLPAVLPQHPELARAMLDYRYRTLPGARENAKKEGLPGASYAWESAATGKETLQDGVYLHGRHVTGDVALAMKQYVTATGDQEWLKTHGWPILKETAANWVARAKPDGKGGLMFKQVTTPDELAARVDYSAWTQHVARVNLEFAAEAAKQIGQAPVPAWAQTAAKLGYLRDPATKLILPYQGFTERSKSKQADLLLVAFPGEEKLTQEELGKTYDYYAPKVINNGPAMTDAIHAVIAARLGKDDEALKRFQESYRPFVRPPYSLFSEKRSRDNLAFHTGAAGVVEAVLYGFAGIHLEPDASHPDRPRVEPHVPATWKSLRVNDLHWRGKRWDLELKPGAPPVWTTHAAK